MGWGSLLTSLAVLIGLIAYVAHPLFRTAPDADRVVEAWVAQLRSERAGSAPAAAVVRAAVAEGGDDADDVINFCPRCGRRVEPDHVFCPKCGKQLTKGDVL